MKKFMKIAIVLNIVAGAIGSGSAVVYAGDSQGEPGRCAYVGSGGCSEGLCYCEDEEYQPWDCRTTGDCIQNSIFCCRNSQ